MTEETQIREAIQQAIDEHELILFMKGTPEQPACGFSARMVEMYESGELAQALGIAPSAEAPAEALAPAQPYPAPIG